MWQDLDKPKPLCGMVKSSARGLTVAVMFGKQQEHTQKRRKSLPCRSGVYRMEKACWLKKPEYYTTNTDTCDVTDVFSALVFGISAAQVRPKPFPVPFWTCSACGGMSRLNLPKKIKIFWCLKAATEKGIGVQGEREKDVASKNGFFPFPFVRSLINENLYQYTKKEDLPWINC